MENLEQGSPGNGGYNIMHFEALGPETQHLKEEIEKAKQSNEIPEDHRYLITPKTVQDFLRDNPGAILPDIITMKTHSILPESYLAGNKKSVITRSAGYDHLEHLAEKANIASLRKYCVNAVAQTAMKFIYAAAGELNHFTGNTATFERKDSRAFMELDRHRTLTVFGVGKIGRRIYDLALANGLTVFGVDIRQKELDKLYGGSVQFVSKEDAILSSNIIVNAMNLTKNKENKFYNVGYFSKEYLAKAPGNIIFINVTRGEIAPESGLLELYRSGKITGIGLDVFSSEPEFTRILSGEAITGADLMAAKILVEKSIDRSANVYVQPHQAFNSDIAAQTKALETVKHLISWYKNGKQHFDEQLPYY